MVWNLHQVSNAFLQGNISSSHLISHLSACSLLLLVHLASFFFNLHFSLISPTNIYWDQKKVGMIRQGLHYQTVFPPSLRCWPPHRRCPGSPPVQMACRLALLIISGHCYRHLCSSHWPPAGDAGLFCCSTCGHPAARALRNTGTLRSLPAPKLTPAGRGGQTSPGTATT